MVVEIECPHCKVSFNSNDALLKERQDKYRWHEFSGKASHCPNCEGRYQIDLSSRGLFIVLFLFVLMSPLVYFEYEFMIFVVCFFALYIVKKHYWKVMKVTRT